MLIFSFIVFFFLQMYSIFPDNKNREMYTIFPDGGSNIYCYNIVITLFPFVTLYCQRNFSQRALYHTYIYIRKSCLETSVKLPSRPKAEITVSYHAEWRNRAGCPSSSLISRNVRLPCLRTCKLFPFILARPGSCTYPAG